uniref:Reverse transcriptase Ty1/copia-type domain-containing protein n=1 Tax=Fagus sylvatica TaxID=28930 RepID=A0A2N9GQ49_FAGSY
MSDDSIKSTVVPPSSSTANPSKGNGTNSESHSVQITTIRLNGDNFLRWSQSVRMYIRGRGKMGYLTGEKTAPAEADPTYATWDAENSMVMTWLVNSMEEDISSNYMCYPTAQELWENVNQMYSDLGNQSQIFELTLKLGEMRQGEDSVTKYFNSLKRVWQDLDLFNTYEWKSVEDSRHHKKIVEDNRIFKFLAGLNIECDEVRGRVIGRQPVPTIGDVFSEVRREESRRNVMLGKKGPGVAVESSALVAADANSSKAITYQRRTDDKPQVWCDYCNKPRHTRETCWKIHGKPANWKSSKPGDRSGRAFPTANEAEVTSFTKEQMEHLLTLLKSNSSSGIPSVSVAQTGNEPNALSCCLNSSAPWIIDSGASDHMTSSHNFFESYSPCSGIEKVRIADGSFSSIAGKGLIKISERIDLKSVLHVPKLACNLLSDQSSGRTIGSARMINGLYYFDDNLSSDKKAQGFSSISSISVREQIMGEIIGEEDNFWEKSAPLPNTIVDFPSQDTESSPQIFPEIENSIQDAGSGRISFLPTEKEILQKDTCNPNSELLVYTRKRIPERSKDLPIIPVQNQSESLNNGSLNISGNSSPIPILSNSIPILSSAPISDSDPIISPKNKTSDLDIPIAIRKGIRTCTKYPIAKYISYQRLSNNHRAFISNISHVVVVPRNIQEALDDPNWKLAVLEEMNALRKNGTWELVDLPRDKKIVGCKWVFSVKYKADGSIERYKARLVAKGFTQTYGIDYQETFAPVAKINSIRVLLSLAVNSNWPLHQLDVKNAFLNGDLEEEVFMSLPPGFEERLGVDKVCRLRKSLYGLKQSPRAWFERFGRAVRRHGYCQSQADHTMFYKHSKEGKIAILIVYVDDIILTGDDSAELKKLKERLADEFEIKDLGALKYFLGMEFAKSKEGIFVNQRKPKV